MVLAHCLPRPERQKKHSNMVQHDILLLLAVAAVLELAVPLKIDIDDDERERDQRGAPPPPPRFPPPRWVPTWNLTQSTMIQPSSVGYFTPAHSWGLVSLDWTVARSVWLSHGRNRQDCEAVSTEGCRRLKASGLAHRCFVYHNMELALEWLESQRVAMRSPSKSGFFLQYTDGFGHKNGTVYDELGRFGGRVMGDQYFWDHTNKAASEFFVSSVLSAVDHPAVDGTFTDDVTGLPNEHHAVTGRINMTQPQLRALQRATAAAHAKLVAGLIARGKYNWQAFFGNDVALGDDAAGVQIGRGEMCTRFILFSLGWTRDRVSNSL